MKIKHLFLGIGVMVFASCAVDKTKKLDVDKELTYCDMQIHRALSELEKMGNLIIPWNHVIFWLGSGSGTAKRCLGKNGRVDFGREFCGMITKQLRMIRFGCWLRNIRSRWNFFKDSCIRS